jgi:predicted phosphodiesterase
MDINMRKNRILFSFFLILNLLPSSALAQFETPPYSLKKENGDILLNFSLKTHKELIISRDYIKSFDSSESFKAKKHYQVNMGTALCENEDRFFIRDAKSGETLFEKIFPASLCYKRTHQEDFSFGFISDTQEHLSRHKKISKVIEEHQKNSPLQFILNAGDIVQNGSVKENWESFFKGGSEYIRKVPLIAAIGNHDYRGHKGSSLPILFKKYLRWEGSQKDGNLHFAFPEFELLVFNSNFIEMSKQKQERQWTWLNLQLAKVKKRKKPAVIVTHFPVYSSSLNRFTSRSVAILRKRMPSLLEKYGVKLFLAGHTHMYERSLRNGITYLVAGPAGGRINSPSFKNPYVQYINSDVLSFTKITFREGTFFIKTYNEENEIIDQFEVKY